MSLTKYEWQPLLKRKAANVLTDNTGFRQKKKKKIKKGDSTTFQRRHDILNFGKRKEIRDLGMTEFFQEIDTFLIHFKIDTVIKIYNK